MNVFELAEIVPGEPERLDYIIREHEKLERRFAALADLLVEKQILSRDEVDRLKSEEGTANK